MACSIFPSTEQIEALAILVDNDISQVLDWVALLRSIEPGFEYCSQPRGLPLIVVNAIIALKDCEDELLTLWLNMARSHGMSANWILIFEPIADSYLSR